MTEYICLLCLLLCVPPVELLRYLIFFALARPHPLLSLTHLAPHRYSGTSTTRHETGSKKQHGHTLATRVACWCRHSFAVSVSLSLPALLRAAHLARMTSAIDHIPHTLHACMCEYVSHECATCWGRVILLVALASPLLPLSIASLPFPSLITARHSTHTPTLTHTHAATIVSIDRGQLVCIRGRIIRRIQFIFERHG